MSGVDVPEDYRPRLCHVVKWHDFQGYGFNLHAEKGKAGQFIGKVDPNSPAEAAGLKEGDRIIEVNGINIGNENHQQVVTRIKSGGEETRLLVVDSESDSWYKEHKRIVRGDLPEIRLLSARRGGEEKEEEQQSKTQPSSIEHRLVDGESGEEHTYSHVDHTEADVKETTVTSSVATSLHNGSISSEDDSYKPRLCHLKLWPHFQGYGFNLHAERDKPGQYIGLVDENSPASTAGLRVQDRIIEVNGVNVEQEKHTEVIARIKAVPGETKLLVVDRDTDAHYKERGITISSSMPQTQYIATSESTTAAAVSDVSAEKEADVNSVEQAGVVEQANVVEKVELASVDHSTLASAEPTDEEPTDVKPTDEEPEAGLGDISQSGDISSRNSYREDNPENVLAKFDEEIIEENLQKDVVEGQEQVTAVSLEGPGAESEKAAVSEVTNGIKSASVNAGSQSAERETTSTGSAQQAQAAASPPSSKPGQDLELNLSAAEMRERLKAKKRQDPRLNKIPFEQKYKEFQRM